MGQNIKGYNILLVGNNPKELAGYYLNLLKFERIKFLADVCFDLKESINRVFRNRPNYILLDDRYPVKQLRKFINRIRRNNQTQDIPVGILKTSNRSDILIHDIQDYFLKDNFSAERLFYSLSNSRKFRRAQIILYKTYKKNKKRYHDFSARIRDFANRILPF